MQHPIHNQQSSRILQTSQQLLHSRTLQDQSKRRRLHRKSSIKLHPIQHSSHTQPTFQAVRRKRRRIPTQLRLKQTPNYINHNTNRPQPLQIQKYTKTHPLPQEQPAHSTKRATKPTSHKQHTQHQLLLQRQTNRKRSRRESLQHQQLQASTTKVPIGNPIQH